jgi:acyl carrier protein
MAKKESFDEIKNEIRQLVSEIADIPLAELRDEAKFAEDLGLDSMIALEIIASIEKKYKVSIPEEEIPNIRSLQETYTLIEKLLKK